MDINFSIDFDQDEVHVVIDHCLSLSVTKEDENTFVYKNFAKVEDEEFRRKIKDIVKTLFSLQEL